MCVLEVGDEARVIGQALQITTFKRKEKQAEADPNLGVPHYKVLMATARTD